jgi:hypothetical protein
VGDIDVCKEEARPAAADTSAVRTWRGDRCAWAGWSSVARAVLELDHVFCFVSDPDGAARRLEDDGWMLDAGQAHRGQGTRNRRLLWPRQYLELLWLTNAAEARTNPLRLDRRAAWTTTGACPFGLGFRGRVEQADGDEFWLYDALGPRIWIHRDNERCPGRPLVFVLEADAEAMQQRRRQRA